MSDYLDGELAASGRARMERHLGECAECRRLLAGLRAVVDGLHRLPAPSGGAGRGPDRRVGARAAERASDT